MSSSSSSSRAVEDHSRGGAGGRAGGDIQRIPRAVVENRTAHDGIADGVREPAALYGDGLSITVTYTVR